MMPSVFALLRAGPAVALLLAAGLASAAEAVVPLRHAHAHNDYEHARPLRDALAHGFCSVEADVYLADGRLLVGHDRKDLRPGRTLEKLYLDPLRERARAHAGHIYADGPPFFLLIDVKSEAGPTWAALDRVLARYADVLTTCRAGTCTPGAVTVVISGNCDRQGIAAQKVRYAAIDGRPPDLDTDAPAHLVPWVSARWGALFRWNGAGPMQPAERARLRAFTGKAHAQGRLVRFWATPEKEAVWKELRADGVDLLNTDRLADLQRFLLGQKPATPKP